MIHPSPAASLPLDPRELLLSMRCPMSEHTPDLLAAASTAITRARALSTPRTLWRIVSLAWADGAPTLADVALPLPGRDIADHLAGCTRCLLTATTLGIATERELLRLTPSPADALYFDAACSLLVEAAAEEAEAAILADTAHTRATFRYAPGYGDLPLTIQPQFLAALDAPRQLGLTLTQSGLMLPRKSITGIVGIE